jgi:hypothetical protein
VGACDKRAHFGTDRGVLVSGMRTALLLSALQALHTNPQKTSL